MPKTRTKKSNNRYDPIDKSSIEKINDELTTQNRELLEKIADEKNRAIKFVVNHTKKHLYDIITGTTTTIDGCCYVNRHLKDISSILKGHYSDFVLQNSHRWK
jgi:hypothetical protein